VFVINALARATIKVIISRKKSQKGAGLPVIVETMKDGN